METILFRDSLFVVFDLVLTNPHTTLIFTEPATSYQHTVGSIAHRMESYPDVLLRVVDCAETYYGIFKQNGDLVPYPRLIHFIINVETDVTDSINRLRKLSLLSQ